MSDLTRGKVARMAQVGPETVRYYEREGILQKPLRRANGYRVYDKEAVRRILFVKQARELGFSLAEVKGLLELAADPKGTCGPVRQKTQDKLRRIEEKIRSLERMRQALATLLQQCDDESRHVSQCPILESLQPSSSQPKTEKG